MPATVACTLQGDAIDSAGGACIFEGARAHRDDLNAHFGVGRCRNQLVPEDNTPFALGEHLALLTIVGHPVAVQTDFWRHVWCDTALEAQGILARMSIGGHSYRLSQQLPVDGSALRVEDFEPAVGHGILRVTRYQVPN